MNTANTDTRQRARVLIASPEAGGPKTYTGILARELPKLGVAVSVEGFSALLSLPPILRHTAFALILAARAFGADVVYAQDPVSTGLPAYLAARITGRRFVLKVVGDFAWEQGVIRYGVRCPLDEFEKYADAHWYVKLLRALESFVGRHADRVVVPSNYLARVVARWGVERERVSVIRNGFSAHDDERSRDGIRSELGLDGFVIISAGRLVPWKGFESLIEAALELKREIPAVRILIAGGGPDWESLGALIRRVGAGDVVEMLGHLPQFELHRYLRGSDLFVLNSSYEGMSHQLLEAMALGVPIVTTSAGGNPEMLSDNREALLVPLGDRRALVWAICELYKNVSLRETLARAARERVREFSEEKMVSETAKIFL